MIRGAPLFQRSLRIFKTLYTEKKGIRLLTDVDQSSRAAAMTPPRDVLVDQSTRAVGMTPPRKVLLSREQLSVKAHPAIEVQYHCCTFFLAEIFLGDRAP